MLVDGDIGHCGQISAVPKMVLEPPEQNGPNANRGRGIKEVLAVDYDDFLFGVEHHSTSIPT